MILDVVILVILIIPMALGLYRGFLRMLMRLAGWIGALIAAFFLTEPLSGILEKGFVGDMISSGLSERFANSVDAVDTATEGLPDIVSGGLTATAESVSDIFVALVASMLISVMSFILIVFVVKLAAGIIVRPAARRRSGGLLTGMDRLLGLIIGFAEGLLLVFVFLALLVPAVNFADGAMSANIMKSLNESVIAQSLYDNNVLLLFTGGIFS